MNHIRTTLIARHCFSQRFFCTDYSNTVCIRICIGHCIQCTLIMSNFNCILKPCTFSWPDILCVHSNTHVSTLRACIRINSARGNFLMNAPHDRICWCDLWIRLFQMVAHIHSATTTTYSNSLISCQQRLALTPSWSGKGVRVSQHWCCPRHSCARQCIQHTAH